MAIGDRAHVALATEIKTLLASGSAEVGRHALIACLMEDAANLVSLGTWVNGSNSNLPFGADYFAQSNPDGNGYYQTITYKSGGSGGTTVKTVTMTFDANGEILTYAEA